MTYTLSPYLLLLLLVLCCCCTWSQRTFLMEKRPVRKSGAAPHTAVGVVSVTWGERPVAPLEADL